jgi:hypothetical protein
MNISSASGFRRTACGLILLAAPAMILVASIFDQGAGSGDDTREFLQSLKDEPDLVQLSSALYILGFALMAIGIVGLVHVIRERGVVLANLGGVLAILGMIMLTAFSTTNLLQLNEAEHLDLGVAVQLTEDMQEDYWAAAVVFFPAFLGTILGFILLGAAIIRSKVVHLAAGVLIIVGVILIPFSGESKEVGIAANVLLLGGWGLVGLKLLGMKDEEWDSSTTSPGSGTPASG